MNHSLREAETYVQTLSTFLTRTPTRAQVFLVPPFTALARVCHLLVDTPVLVGAQNMHWKDQGAYTGEISPAMIKDCGAHIVELGHSERRAEFGETDWTVNLKVLAALRQGLIPLVCVGERAREKEFGVAREFVVRQVKIALHGVPPGEMGRVWLAYEPVWAIGEAGVPAKPDDANGIHGAIRDAVAELYGNSIASEVPILYGGSVNRDNALSFLRQPSIDGLFIGRAAWQVQGLIEIIQLANRNLQV